MVLRIGLRILAAYLTATGAIRLVCTIDLDTVWHFCYNLTTVDEVNRALFGMLLLFLWLYLLRTTDFPVEVIVIPVTVYITAKATFKLARNINPTAIGIFLLLLGLGVHAVKDDEAVRQFTVIMSCMLPFLVISDFQPSRQFGMLRLLLGLSLHLISVAI